MPDNPRYDKVENEFRELLWRHFPGATTNQVHATARKFTDLVREENEQYARELKERGAMTDSPNTLSIGQPGVSRILDRYEPTDVERGAVKPTDSGEAS